MIPTTISPFVTKQAALYGRQIQLGPRGLLSSLNPLWFPLPPASGSAVTNDHRELVQVEVNNTSNQFTNSGTPERTEQPPSTVESGAGNRPADKAAYKRFNGKEQKEREKSAESWISAVIKKHVESTRKASKTKIQVVKKDSFLYEYAVYQKDRYFIGNIR